MLIKKITFTILIFLAHFNLCFNETNKTIKEYTNALNRIIKIQKQLDKNPDNKTELQEELITIEERVKEIETTLQRTNNTDVLDDSSEETFNVIESETSQTIDNCPIDILRKKHIKIINSSAFKRLFENLSFKGLLTEYKLIAERLFTEQEFSLPFTALILSTIGTLQLKKQELKNPKYKNMLSKILYILNQIKNKIEFNKIIETTFGQMFLQQVKEASYFLFIKSIKMTPVLAKLIISGIFQGITNSIKGMFTSKKKNLEEIF